MAETILEQRASPKIKKVSFGNPFVVGNMAEYDVSGIADDDSVLMSAVTSGTYLSNPGTATKTFQTGLSEAYAIGLCYFAYGEQAKEDMFYRFCISKTDYGALSSGTVDMPASKNSKVASCQYTVSANGDITLKITNTTAAHSWTATYLFGLEVWGR